MRRANLLIAASALAMLGWGTVLPYQYAYAAQTRGWGGGIAAAAASLFSVGALVAAPVAGRLADRVPAATVAVVARFAAALVAVSLLAAGRPGLFLVVMAAFGFAVAAGAPAQSVLVLRWVPAADRRRVFAWQFSGQALGMGVGALAAGYLVDLSRPDGMAPAFVAAALGFAAAGVLTLVARRGAAHLDRIDLHQATVDPRELSRTTRTAGARAAYAEILAQPGLRLALLVTVLLGLAFYAQFESGLPAYALTELDLSGRTVGVAAAVNCVVIVALQMVVVRWTAHRSAPTLLAGVALLWLVCWVVLGTLLGVPALAAGMFVAVYGLFAVGETMYAPILNPMVASLAPAPLVGTTLGLVAAVQTGASAAGPLLSGVLLAAGVPAVFVGVHVVICVLAALAAWRLRLRLRPAARPEPVGHLRAQTDGEEVHRLAT